MAKFSLANTNANIIPTGYGYDFMMYNYHPYQLMGCNCTLELEQCLRNQTTSVLAEEIVETMFDQSDLRCLRLEKREENCVEWDDFFSTFSLVAVATVLLTKDYISNTVNGLINMMSDQLALGDRVKIGTHEGTIKDITLSNVYLEDEEENHIIIPNNTVFAADVINYNQQRGELVEVPVELHPDTVGNITEWETRIKESLQPFHSYINLAKVKVRLQHVSTDKVQLVVQFRSKTSSPGRKKEMIHTILQQFITARTSSLKKD